MKNLYYINGKRVNAETYYQSVENEEKSNYLNKTCIEYFKKHPDEFKSMCYSSKDEQMLFFNMMMHYMRTEEYKEAEETFDKKYRRKILIYLIVMFLLFFVGPIIFIILQ